MTSVSLTITRHVEHRYYHRRCREYSDGQIEKSLLFLNRHSVTYDYRMIRPPDIPVGGLIFYWNSSFFPFFATYPPSWLNGTQRKSATWSEVSVIWKRMSKIWGIPSHTNTGSKNHLFRRLRNVTANFTAYISGTKHDIKRHELWSTNGLKPDRSFYPPCFILSQSSAHPLSGVGPWRF